MSIEKIERIPRTSKQELKELKASIELHESETELICKDGIKRALATINDMKDLPIGGKKVDYYWQDGIHKGKKMTPEQIKSHNLPAYFDIDPRKVKDPVDILQLHIWGRKFTVELDFGKIQDIKFTSNSLDIQTTLFFTKSFDKQKKLPDLLRRLWQTPKGKWEKPGFLGVTVKEV